MNYSRQRAEVLDQIREHEDHPTADVIFAELRQKDPSISLATEHWIRRRKCIFREPSQVMIWSSEEYVMTAELWRVPKNHKK